MKNRTFVVYSFEFIAMAFSNQQLDLTQLPKTEEIAYIPVEKKYVNVLYIKYIVSCGIPLVACFVASYLMKDYRLELLCVGIFFFILLIALMLLTRKIYAFRGYALRENDVCSRKGIIFNKYTSVPFRRIQHISVEQGLFSRWFGLAALNVYSAAGTKNDFVINGITKQRADEMKHFILETIKDDETN